MEQVPAATIFAVVPDTEHVAGVKELKVTARPELAEAMRETVPPTTDRKSVV